MEYIMNSTEEIKASASFTTIRYVVIKNTVSTTADLDADLPLEQSWSDPSYRESLRWMSAVCFLYARSLHQLWLASGQEVVPIGLVDSDWSGTQVEGWSTPHSLETCTARQGPRFSIRMVIGIFCSDTETGAATPPGVMQKK